MYLVQILLPLRDNAGKPLKRQVYQDIQHELTQRFKGLTAYSRAPAEGLWKPRQGTRRDQIIVYEVMVSSFEKVWWRRYQARLEKLMRQESIVIRVQKTALV
jgi:hypothetical protein